MGWLAILLSPWGRLAGAALIAGGVGYVAGYRRAERTADTANLLAQIAVLKTDNAITSLAEKRARADADTLQKQADNLEGTLHEIADEAAKAPASARCILGPDRARRLRGIR